MVDNTRPAYRILSPSGFFGPDDHLWPEGEKIYFDGEPNEEMEPLNTLATERLNTYLEKLDELARETASKTGKPFIARPRTMDGALELATAVQRADMGIMGNRNKELSVERVDGNEIAETSLPNPKRGRGRPSKTSTLVQSAA